MKWYSTPCFSPGRGDRVVSITNRQLQEQWQKEGGGPGGDQRETEKPKVLGWSAKRRLRRVDLPAPEGPEITTGRCFCVAETLVNG